MIGVARYLRQYFRAKPGAVQVLDANYTRAGATLPAQVYRPVGLKERVPAWIVLHGLTYHGANHPGLQRFASALAAAGHVVFIPEIPEWSRLLVTPALTTPTIRAAAHALTLRNDVDPERVGIFGFSFGATHGLRAATDDDVVGHARAVVAWGGYSDLARLVHFGLTGEHDFDDVPHRVEPDPYGRWMFGGNYLSAIPGYEDMHQAAAALLELARAAGRSGIYAGEFARDPLVGRLAQRLSPREREVFELFAPTGQHDMAAARELSKQLAAAIAAQDPLMTPGPEMEQIRLPVLLAHGRDDRLVPYTETLRMRRRLPDDKVLGCTITSLFAHSGGTEPDLGPVGLVRETGRFLGVLNRILRTL